jgi:hypothetical protein
MGAEGKEMVSERHPPLKIVLDGDSSLLCLRSTHLIATQLIVPRSFGVRRGRRAGCVDFEFGPGRAERASGRAGGSESGALSDLAVLT